MSGFGDGPAAAPPAPKRRFCRRVSGAGSRETAIDVKTLGTYHHCAAERPPQIFKLHRLPGSRPKGSVIANLEKPGKPGLFLIEPFAMRFGWKETKASQRPILTSVEVSEVRSGNAKRRGSWGFFGLARPISLIHIEMLAVGEGLRTNSLLEGHLS